MKTAKDPGELPSNPVPDGERVFATVTFDCEDDDPCTEDTAVDIAPGRLNTYFRHHGLVTTFEFRIVTKNRLLHSWALWLAATFDRALPIAPRDIHRHDDVAIQIEPPWLDFRLRIRTHSEADADKIMSMLTSHNPAGS